MSEQRQRPAHWLRAPRASGDYWAYRPGRTRDPVLCRVGLVEGGRWTVRFEAGGTYTFSESGRWLWRPAGGAA
jgi:hypothetical protein